MNLSKNQRFDFEILKASPDDPMLAAGEYYVTIRDRAGTPLIDTCLSHRFSSVPDAQDFCRCIEDGTLPVHQVMNESIQRIQQQAEDRKEVGKMKFEHFLSDVQALGVSPETLRTILEAYDKLPIEARDLLRNEQAVIAFQKSHPVPNPNALTFGALLEASKEDVDVCLIDADTGEHYLNAVCYLTEADKKDPDLQYTELEQWLFTLPVDKVLTTEYNTRLIVLRTSFSCDQANFLLSDAQYGFDTKEWAKLYDRAHFADADFNARLAFLKDGTSFETSFDRDTMNALSPADRTELLSFLSAHPHAFIAPAQDDFLVVYDLVDTPNGGVRAVDCPVCVVKTEPGRGLSSSLEYIVSDAQQKSNQGETPTSPHLGHEAERG